MNKTKQQQEQQDGNVKKSRFPTLQPILEF